MIVKARKSETKKTKREEEPHIEREEEDKGNGFWDHGFMLLGF